jgi:hypothetical protein
VIALVLGDAEARAEGLEHALRHERWLLNDSAGSRYSMPRCREEVDSLVKAAFMTSGVPATMGHEALSIVSARSSARA